MTTGCVAILWTVRRYLEPVGFLGLMCVFALTLQPISTAQGVEDKNAPAEAAGKTVAADQGTADKPTMADRQNQAVTARIDSIDDHFAPRLLPGGTARETVEIKYTVLVGDASKAKIEVHKQEFDNDGNLKGWVLVFDDQNIDATKGQHTYNWDGKDKDGKYVGPQDSPYSVMIYAGKDGFSGAVPSKAETTKVLIESMTIAPAAETDPTKVIMNDPETKKEITVLVKLKSKDGTGVLTDVSIPVDFSFTDPDPANTPWDESFKYDEANDKYLGKAENAYKVTRGLMWAEHDSAPAGATSSTDDFKLTCKTRTVVDGDNKGMAFVNFLPSGVGGDNYILKAAVKHTNGKELDSKESNVLEVWRKITFTGIYEMTGVNHLSANSTNALIQPYFDEAYIQYERGPVGDPIVAERSIKYAGLWRAGATEAPYQRDWDALATPIARNPRHTVVYGSYKEQKYMNIVYKDPDDPEAVEEDGVPTEIITERDKEEAAKGTASLVRLELAWSFAMRAQAWVERIEQSFESDLGQFEADNGFTQDATRFCMIGIKYYHPKFNSEAGDSATNLWPDDLRSSTNKGTLYNDPDDIFGAGEIRGYSSPLSGNIVIALMADAEPAEYQLTIVHEIAHATLTLRNDLEPSMYRQKFGEGDHSSESGLMDSEGSGESFTEKENKILRGIVP